VRYGRSDTAGQDFGVFLGFAASRSACLPQAGFEILSGELASSAYLAIKKC
jgi:hypothetical protein